MFYRAIHSTGTTNIASFMTDIITSDLVTHPKEHVSDLYKQYRQILKTLLDKHASTKSKSVSQKPPAPWMTPEIIQSKRRRRYLERVSRSVPLLKSLHWLPVHYRIIFKMCTIAYQALSSTQPAYLNSMLTPTRNSRQLRSTSSNPLYIPRVKTKAGTRAFSVAAPTVWNSLPASVKSQGNIVSFRRHLKTYLFNAAYPP